MFPVNLFGNNKLQLIEQTNPKCGGIIIIIMGTGLFPEEIDIDRSSPGSSSVILLNLFRVVKDLLLAIRV